MRRYENDPLSECWVHTSLGIRFAGILCYSITHKLVMGYATASLR